MPPVVGAPARLSALAWELARVGTHEQPMGTNRGPLIDEWNRAANGLVGEPWCMSFQHAGFEQAGVKLGGWAGVETFLRWGQQHGYEITRPLRGDIVCFDWNNDRWYDHVGMVVKVLGIGPKGRGPWYLQTVEGNSGDAVRLRKRLTATARFVRVPG